MNTTVIKSVWDNGGKTLDRYTVVFNIEGLALGLSDDPEHPQGFSQCGSGIPGEHLGKLILFEDLPLNVRLHVHKRILSEAKNES